MNQQAFEAGRAAYRKGDLTEAMARLSEAKLPGEVSGSVDHMMGNCLMRLGRYVEAANAYGDALRDSSYGNSGALACNRGRALLAAGKTQEAIASLTMATKDDSYATPYKAYVALGNAYLKMGDARNAGIAFRNAAIDESNPEPAGALRSLGGCFMKMGRPVDAVEAYRTALDFSTPNEDQNAIFADLGMAYVAANRMAEAVDAFGHATADGSFVLGAEFQTAYDAARRAVSAPSSGSPSETDAMLMQAGYGQGGAQSYDPLDPLGESGEFIPSPEDTGFFSITEEELVAADRHDRKGRKRRHGCLRTIFTLLILAALFGGVGYAFYRGFGWPTQEAVVDTLFGSGEREKVIASSVSDDTKARIEALIPSGSPSVKVTGKDATMFDSKVFATATLAAGGEQSYQIEMVREGIGWKVSDLMVDYTAQDEGGAILEDVEVVPEPEPTPEPAPDAEGEAESEGEAEEGEEGEGEGESEEDASSTTEGTVDPA